MPPKEKPEGDAELAAAGVEDAAGALEGGVVIPNGEGELLLLAPNPEKAPAALDEAAPGVAGVAPNPEKAAPALDEAAAGVAPNPEKALPALDEGADGVAPKPEKAPPEAAPEAGKVAPNPEKPPDEADDGVDAGNWTFFVPSEAPNNEPELALGVAAAED